MKRFAMMAFLVACSSTPPGPVGNVTRLPKGAVVLLFSPPAGSISSGENAARQLQPLICVVDGHLGSGATCADLVPEETSIKLVGGGEVHVVRAKGLDHFQAEDFDPKAYPAPYAPACCNYKGCDGKTTQYEVVARESTPLPQGALIAVWPADAAPAIEVNNTAITRKSMRMKASMTPDHLLVTTDLDRDGHKELVIYEPDANDYGVSVNLDSGDGTVVYGFGCGNG